MIRRWVTPRYFVHENFCYPWPGARTPFEVRARGLMDVTIEFCAPKLEADALCNWLNSDGSNPDPELRHNRR